jgi:hypothetical protein
VRSIISPPICAAISRRQISMEIHSRQHLGFARNQFLAHKTRDGVEKDLE